MPRTLAEWLAYLESLHPKSIALGLERVAHVKSRLALDPEFPLIVVGGTNGKGSVCALLESMLHAAGYRVGCYMSPHLLHYNERVRVDKKQINDAELCASFERVERARVATGLKDHDTTLTYFEFGTLAAMHCFIDRKVDVAILEVGLGGRLDAVNIFDSDCSVITAVDIDHTEYLGDSREQIAFEKAGIFRQGRVAVFADNDVPQAINAQAGRVGAELWCLGKEFGFTPHSGQWDYRGRLGSRRALPYPALRGAFQLHNASAALAALDALKDILPVSMESVRRGLVDVQLAGRFQILPGRPSLILDVAHNPHAARSLAQNLLALPSCTHTYAIFAMLRDKDIAGVVAALDGQVDTWLVSGLHSTRGATAKEMEDKLEQGRVRGEIRAFGDIKDALRFAYNAAGENDRIVAFGSFYTVAEAMVAAGLSVR